MRIGLSLKQHIKHLSLLVGVLLVVCGSAVLVDRALAQATPGNEPVASSGQHVLTIHDRGEEQVVITDAKTLRAALKSANIDISIGHDSVEPALDSELVASSYNVNIYRARPITVVDGVVKKNITTAEQTPERIAEAADVKLYTEDDVRFTASTDLQAHGASQVMTIDRATAVQFNLYGKHAEVRTRATTVGDFLKEKGVKMGDR